MFSWPNIMGKTKKNKPKKAEPSSSDNDNELQLPETAKSVPSSTSSSNSKPLKQFHGVRVISIFLSIPSTS